MSRVENNHSEVFETLSGGCGAIRDEKSFGNPSKSIEIPSQAGWGSHMAGMRISDDSHHLRSSSGLSYTCLPPLTRVFTLLENVLWSWKLSRTILRPLEGWKHRGRYITKGKGENPLKTNKNQRFSFIFPPPRGNRSRTQKICFRSWNKNLSGRTLNYNHMNTTRPIKPVG